MPKVGMGGRGVGGLANNGERYEGTGRGGGHDRLRKGRLKVRNTTGNNKKKVYKWIRCCGKRRVGRRALLGSV